MTRTEMARRRHRLSRHIREVVAQRRYDAIVYPIRPTSEADPGTVADIGFLAEAS